MNEYNKIVYREWRIRRIKKLKVVYSKEEPRKSMVNIINETEKPKKPVPGSVSFMPSVAGLIIAGEVIKDIVNIR